MSGGVTYVDQLGPAIVFPDARRPTRDLLRELLLDRPEPFTRGVTVSTKPLPGSTGARPLPYVQVKSDARFRDARLNGRASLRFLVWHTDEGFAEDLAALCEALLLSSRTDGIRGYAPISGSIPTYDDEADLPLSFFTLTARLAPRQLA